MINWPSLLSDFATLWATIDPLGTIPIFLAVAGWRPRNELNRIANQAVLVAGGVLLGFLIFGQIVLNALGIGIDSFQIAGGIILFRFGMSMMFSEPKSGSANSVEVEGNPAIFPVAIPAMAGPGAMLAVVVLTDNDRFSVPEQAGTAVVLLVVLFAQWLLLRAALPIQNWLGQGGMSILSRVMGLILSAVAVQTIVEGLKGIGLIPKI